MPLFFSDLRSRFAFMDGGLPYLHGQFTDVGFGPILDNFCCIGCAYLSIQQRRTMAHLSNINVRHRLTQVIVLIILILITMLFSQVAHAQWPKKMARFDKPKHRIAIHSNSGKACYILHKKRTSMPKHPLFASSRRSKIKPMAETDKPTRILSSN